MTETLARIRAIEAHDVAIGRACVASHQRLAPEDDAEAIDVGGALVCYAGPGSHHNRVTGLGMNGTPGPDGFARIEAFYARHRVPPAVELCPYADPTVTEWLGRLRVAPGPWKHVFVRTLDGHVPAAPSPDITVEVVGPEGIDVWAETVAHGFLDRPPATPADVRLAQVLARVATTRCFLARVEGVPAGAGSVNVLDGMAALASGSTLPAFRGRGVQTALLRARLAHARAADCTLARVSCAPGTGSQRNIERAGFQLAYSRLSLIVRAA